MGITSMSEKSTEDRFWEKVEQTATCWIWKASTSSGYGDFWVDGKTVKAHRYAYTLLVGPIPEGMELDHVRERGCTMTNCVNPAHLEPVTHTVNVLRGNGACAQNARQTHCVRGHEFTPENTHVW